MGLFSAFRSFLAGGAGRASAPYGRALTQLPPAATLSHEGRGDQTGKADGVDWQEVRRVYEAGEVPLKAIYGRFAVSRRAVRQRSLEEGWRLRPQIAKPGPKQGQRRHNPKSLTRRLLRVAGERLARLEEAAADGTAARPTAEELKAMAELARALPALMREDRLVGGGAGQEAGPASRAEAAERAREAAERARQKEIDRADEDFMRAELKRRTDILAAEYRRYKAVGRGEEFLAAVAERRPRPLACEPAMQEDGGGAAAGACRG